MASALALRTFRSCTTSLSSRTLSRSAIPHSSRTSPLSRRHYTEQKTEEKPPAGDAAGTAEVKEGSQPKEAESPEAVKLKAKEAEVVDLTSRLRYLQADFLNLQRNSAREKEQTRDFAISRFASDLLETADVLAIALKSVPPSAISSRSNESAPSSDASTPPSKTPEAHLNDLYTGVEMTHRLLLQTLFKYHVKPFDPTGDRFDPNLHEALYQAPIPGKEPGTVVDCQKTGYMIKDRVLRAAQVGVAQES